MSPSRDLVGYGANPPKGRWPGGARVAVNLVINVEEGSERSWWAGDRKNEGLSEIPRAIDPRYRDLGTESIYEYGSRAGIHRLLRMLDRLGVKCTAFAAAQALELNPDATEHLVRSEHEICGHGYRWGETWLLSEEQEKRSIEMSIETITRLTGQAPVGWYSRWMPSDNTRRLLVENGSFLYDSDSYADDLPYYVEVEQKPHLVVPYSMTYNDVHFTYGQMASPTDFVDYCRRGLGFLLAEGDDVPRMLSLGVHPRIMGQAARTSALEEFLAYAASRDDVWVTTRAEIAQFWVGAFPSEG